MDTQTIITLASICTCVIGIATFVTGMIIRAKSDGKLIGKVEYICGKVDELSTDIKANEKLRQKADLETARQQEQIKTLFTQDNQLQRDISNLQERMNSYERNQQTRESIQRGPN